MSIPLDLRASMNKAGGMHLSGVSTPLSVMRPSADIIAVTAAGNDVIRIIEVSPVASS
jgi:hypothetical protein